MAWTGKWDAVNSGAELPAAVVEAMHNTPLPRPVFDTWPASNSSYHSKWLRRWLMMEPQTRNSSTVSAAPALVELAATMWLIPVKRRENG